MTHPRSSSLPYRARILLLSGIIAALMTFVPSFAGTSFAAERVMFQAFMVNAWRKDGRRVDRVPLTIHLSIKNKKRGNYVCQLAPKVIDSILRHLSRQRFKRGNDGRLVYGTLLTDLKPVVTTALRWDIVQGFTVREGVPKVSSSSAQLFTRTGCMIDSTVKRSAAKKKQKKSQTRKKR